MTRVLLYGGCHAQVLRDCLVSTFDPAILDVELLINFELIRTKKPFPLDLLQSCDVLIFSPIENKGVYNTDLLVERCRSLGKRTICFPWLEWHGYCPGATKGIFKAHHQWYYPKLLEIASAFDDFDAFRDYAIAHFPDEDVIENTLLHSGAKVRAAEARHAMRVCVSDFIADHYREERLFLISDHPSRRTYEHVLKQILDELGLPFRETMLVGEPQGSWRTPIFPRVTRHLGLEFDDSSWADEILVPNQLSSLDTYLRLYFHADGVVLAPRIAATVIPHAPSASASLHADCATRLLATPLAHDHRSGEASYEFLGTLAGPAIPLEPHTPFSIESHLWRQTWDQ